MCIHIEEHVRKNQTLCVKDIIRVVGGKRKHQGDSNSSTTDSVGREVKKLSS